MVNAGRACYMGMGVRMPKYLTIYYRSTGSLHENMRICQGNLGEFSGKNCPTSIAINQLAVKITRRSLSFGCICINSSTCWTLTLDVSLLQVAATNAGQASSAAKAERRVTVMVILMVGCFLLAWTPYALFALVMVFGTTSPPLYSGTLPSLLAKSSCIYNPLIYVSVNKQVSNDHFAVWVVNSYNSNTTALEIPYIVYHSDSDFIPLDKTPLNMYQHIAIFHRTWQ